MNMDELKHIRKGLTRLSMECILSYMDPSERLCLSYFYPKFRPIEKGVPLVLNLFHISASEISIDENILQIPNDKSSEVAFSKVCFDLFTGRKQFEVRSFINNHLFPFEMNMNVFRVVVSPSNGFFARHYSNINGTIKHVVFIGLDRPEDFRLPWVRNVELLQSNSGNCSLFVNELPNMSIKKICIDCRIDTNLCSSLITGWCENKTRPVGSELILIMSRYGERINLAHIFSRDLLAVFGFVRHEDDSLRLPIDNNLEVVLRMKNEKDIFPPIYLNSTKAGNYLHLTIEHKQF